MPINHEHQISILKDILAEHQLDCCGTVSEYEQMERLIKSLLANNHLQPNVKQSLESIYNYSQKGKNSSDQTIHIQNHQEQIGQWISEINSFY
ncbi:YtzH-like family protein [Bacillus carboniphilus]|uniref:YtzH-like family protein n=1 Tax=Bacillus carboniphilus TaxID=86663 RepID=A0ABY9JP09_9BACI|nr:YtzH-like family protein [Bacillus carboniphilus]WLR41149.1 YtzH-like family protein [Bacillus carboniphilus]